LGKGQVALEKDYNVKWNVSEGLTKNGVLRKGLKNARK
jgi:hypothetical protein